RPSPVRPPGEERNQRPLGFGSNGSPARLGARDPAHPLSRSQASIGRITSLTAQIGGLLSGQTGKHVLILRGKPENMGSFWALSLTPSGHSEGFTRPASALVTDRAMEAWYHSSIA